MVRNRDRGRQVFMQSLRKVQKSHMEKEKRTLKERIPVEQGGKECTNTGSEAWFKK